MLHDSNSEIGQPTIVAGADGRVILTLPPCVKPGLHRAGLPVDEAVETRPTPKAECLKGFWIAPDFAAPLEDFRE